MTYRIRFHPSVADDLDWIAEWISDYAGTSSAASKLDEIEQTIRSLALTPHKGSRRDETAQGLRAIPVYSILREVDANCIHIKTWQTT